jgi:hypothetical protein
MRHCIRGSWTRARVSDVLAAFVGPVRCERQPAGAQLRLRGNARDDGAPLTVCFSGAAAIDLPHVLSELSVLSPPPGSRLWGLQAGTFRAHIAARGVQVTRDVTAAVFAAVPPAPPRVARTLFWFLLLNLLRIPGTAGVLQRLRGR